MPDKFVCPDQSFPARRKSPLTLLPSFEMNGRRLIRAALLGRAKEPISQVLGTPIPMRVVSCAFSQERKKAELASLFPIN